MLTLELSRFIHQTGVMEAAEGCEIRRNGFLPAISSPGRQPQSGSRSRRSNEKQSSDLCEEVTSPQCILCQQPLSSALIHREKQREVPILIPCHRVVCSDGTIGNYSGGGQTVKEWLLAHEGIPTRQPACKGLGLTGTWLKPSRGSTSSKPSGRN
ncbi:hypothetical protein STEG23_031035 [Scotinomys teguina]